MKKIKLKNIQINFTNKFVYTFITLVIFILAVVIVFAFGTSTPSTFGHSAGELDLSSGVSGNAIFNDDVGIGTSTPQVKLDVNGEVRIGNTGIACASNIEGSERYNFVEKVIEYCDGTSWKSFGPTAPPPPVTSLTISSNVSNFNLYSALGNPTNAEDFIVQINLGVAVGSQSTSQPAFTTGNLPAGSTVTLTNNGFIVGKGGNGGKGGDCGVITGGAGGNGGNALELTVPTTINNLGIIGGGGGGGGAAGWEDDFSLAGWGGSGGGGGAGSLVGIGGLAGVCGGSPQPGSDGTLTNGGAAGSPNPGGKGGNLGMNGAKGTAGAQPHIQSSGGAAGSAVITNGNTLTWTNQGDVRGAIN